MHLCAGEDFPLVNESLGRKACRALYYSAMGVSVRGCGRAGGTAHGADAFAQCGRLWTTSIPRQTRCALEVLCAPESEMLCCALLALCA